MITFLVAIGVFLFSTELFLFNRSLGLIFLLYINVLHMVSGDIDPGASVLLNFTGDILLLWYAFLNCILSKRSMAFNSKIAVLRKNRHLVIFCLYSLGVIFFSPNIINAANEAKYFILPMILLLAFRIHPLKTGSIRRLLNNYGLILVFVAAVKMATFGMYKYRFGGLLMSGYGTLGMLSIFGFVIFLVLSTQSGTMQVRTLSYLLLTGLSLLMMILTGARRFWITSVILVAITLHRRVSFAHIKLGKGLLVCLVLFVLSMPFFWSNVEYIKEARTVFYHGISNVDIFGASGRFARYGSYKKGNVYLRMYDAVSRPLGHGWGNVGNTFLGIEVSETARFDGTFNRIGYALGVIGLILFCYVFFREGKIIRQGNLGQEEFDEIIRLLGIGFLILATAGGVFFAKVPVTLFAILLSFYPSKESSSKRLLKRGMRIRPESDLVK